MKRFVKVVVFVLMAIGLIAMILGAQTLLLPWVIWFFVFSLAGWALLKNLRSLTLVLMLVGGFIYICEFLTRISGVGGAAGVAVVGVNPEAGEAIFWGRGKCHTCHSIGSRGSAIRCPNLGDSSLGPTIGVRAEERARQRAAEGASIQSATDYLIETIAEPDAYVVEGFKKEMPYAYLPPISLQPDEVKAVVSYMQSLGGEVDIDAIKLPDKVLKASAEPREPFRPYMTIVNTEEDTVFQGMIPEVYGDPVEGEYLFFETSTNAGCVRCHMAVTLDGEQKGANVGPDLSTVSGTQTPQFILESILAPGAVVASGFEQVRIDTKDGRILAGIPKEDETSITLSQQEGSEVVEITVLKSEIEQLREISTSMMPGNLAELLTVQEFHHLLAYLLTQTGDQVVQEVSAARVE